MDCASAFSFPSIPQVFNIFTSTASGTTDAFVAVNTHIMFVIYASHFPHHQSSTATGHYYDTITLRTVSLLLANRTLVFSLRGV